MSEHSAENGLRATGAIVPERDRCFCEPDLCFDYCRACNYSGRDLEETCIADPDWEPDDEYLAIREARQRVQYLEARAALRGRVFPPGQGRSGAQD